MRKGNEAVLRYSLIIYVLSVSTYFTFSSLKGRGSHDTQPFFLGMSAFDELSNIYWLLVIVVVFVKDQLSIS